MRYSKIHLNPVVFRVAMLLAIVIVGLAGIPPMAAQVTPIGAQAAISNSEPLSGNLSSSQPGVAQITPNTARATITDLGTLGGDRSLAREINDLGQVVGDSAIPMGGHAFLWHTGTMTDLGTLGGSTSVAYGINKHGQVVGGSDTSTDVNFRRAFIWQKGRMTDLGTLGGSYSLANGINNLGQVVGESPIASGARHAFLWHTGTMTDLGTLSGIYSEAKAINDLGQVVGSSVLSLSGWTHAFLWQNGRMRDLGALPGGTQSWAYDINKLGQVVGDSWTSQNTQQHAFLWQTGIITDLGTLGGSDSAAEAINDLGQIVGYSKTGAGVWHNFLWHNGRMIDLNNLVDPSSGWTLDHAYDINNAGQVVGYGRLNSQLYHAILLTLPPDLSVENVVPVQVLENQDLVKDKSTAVKAVIRKSGASTAKNVSVKLVYGASTYERFYVAEKGNLDPNHALIADNSTYPLNFATDEITKTIYFFNDGLAPRGSTFQVSVMVDYLDEVAELDEDNNTTPSSVVPVYDTQWPPGSPFPNLNIYYIRTDGLSRPDRDAFYTASNNLVKGVFPVSERRFIPGRASTTLDTNSARGSDGKLDWLELGQWISDILPILRLAYSDASRYVATVPDGWFQATTIDLDGVNLTNYVGLAYPNTPELVVAEARMGSRPNGSNLVAHEIGHSYGLALTCEEYDADCNHFVDRNGIIAPRGLWVNERIPIQVPTARDVYCFMGAGPGLEYWVDAADYSKLLNDHRAAAALGERESMMAAGAILVVANFDMNGTVTLGNWYTLPEAKLSELPSGPYAFEYQDANGNVLYQRSFDISYSLEGYTLPRVALVATIPAIPNTAKIVVKHNGIPQTEKVVSANTPAVTVISPNGGEQLLGPTTIRWSGSDADGDPLSYVVLISPDNGATWEPIAGNLTATNYTWDTSQLSAGAHYLIKVIATDGINTGHDISDTPFTIKAPTYLPLILHRR